MTHTAYVVGFAIDDLQRVALIQKNRPEWQAGKLNGIGGHIEPGETPREAMAREFFEETGVSIALWDQFLRMEFPGASVFFFRSRIQSATMDKLTTMTDEPVRVTGITDAIILALVGSAIPNLSWLIPLAAYTADRYDPILVTAQIAESL